MVAWIKGPHQIEGKRSGDVKYYIFDESAILGELERIDMNRQRYDIYMNAFTRMQGFEASVEDREKFRILSMGSGKALGGIIRSLGVLYREQGKYLSDLRVVHIEGLFYSTREVKKLFKLAFWCLNPGVVFQRISSDVKSIILTSGTLSPMDSFASELSVPFPIKMEASHIIDPSRVWVGAIAHGPTGLNTSLYYKTIDSFAFQDEIGKSIFGILFLDFIWILFV